MIYDFNEGEKERRIFQKNQEKTRKIFQKDLEKNKNNCQVYEREIIGIFGRIYIRYVAVLHSLPVNNN